MGLAALRSVHGATMAQARSLEDVAQAIAPTSHGMRLAIPEEAKRLGRRIHSAEMVVSLRALVPQGCLKAYNKRLRWPRKPRPQGEGTPKPPHVAMAQLRRKRQVPIATP